MAHHNFDPTAALLPDMIGDNVITQMNEKPDKIAIPPVGDEKTAFSDLEAEIRMISKKMAEEQARADHEGKSNATP